MLLCVVIYMAVAAAAIGAEPYQRFAASPEPLALILRDIGQPLAAKILALSASIGLPTVILAFFYGQSRIFLAMSRDGLFPPFLSRLSSRRNPVRITVFTAVVVGILAGLVPLNELVALANAGTLTAFIAVCAAMLMMRRREPDAKRLFRTPVPWVTGLVGILGCAYLFYSLPRNTQVWFATWNTAGLIVYFLFAARSADRTRGASVVTSPETSAVTVTRASNPTAVIGWILLGAGAFGAVLSLTIRTSVSSPIGEVSNLSLMSQQLNYLILSGFAAVIGAILLLVGRR
jgi:amino acid transporter